MIQKRSYPINASGKLQDKGLPSSCLGWFTCETLFFHDVACQFQVQSLAASVKISQVKGAGKDLGCNTEEQLLTPVNHPDLDGPTGWFIRSLLHMFSPRLHASNPNSGARMMCEICPYEFGLERRLDCLQSPSHLGGDFGHLQYVVACDSAFWCALENGSGWFPEMTELCLSALTVEMHISRTAAVEYQGMPEQEITKFAIYSTWNVYSPLP